MFNNTLMMMNQANLADIVDLAARCGVDAPKLAEVFRASSANSRALELMNTMVTPETVDHLVAVQLLDMEIFAEAMAARDIDAQDATSRAIHGTNALAALVNELSAGETG